MTTYYFGYSVNYKVSVFNVQLTFQDDRSSKTFIDKLVSFDVALFNEKKKQVLFTVTLFY